MNEIDRLNERIAHLEDQLETARVQVEHARVEAEKADDEARHYKDKAIENRYQHEKEAYDALVYWRARATNAEAALATLEGKA